MLTFYYWTFILFSFFPEVKKSVSDFLTHVFEKRRVEEKQVFLKSLKEAQTEY